MIERSLERFDLYPSRLLGDSGYGSAEMLGWLVYEHGMSVVEGTTGPAQTQSRVC
jgi:hypothetical protein